LSTEEKKWKIPPLQQPMDFQYWDANMVITMCNYFRAAKEEHVMAWFQEIRGATFASLATTTEIVGYKHYQVVHADRTLVEALCNRGLPVSLRSQVAQKTEELVRVSRTVLKGRQVIWMIYDYMSLNHHLVGVYSITDLNNFTWLADDRSEEVVKIWRRFTAALKPDRHQRRGVEGSSS
jgi:hypothetical protein